MNRFSIRTVTLAAVGAALGLACARRLLSSSPRSGEESREIDEIRGELEVTNERADRLLTELERSREIRAANAAVRAAMEARMARMVRKRPGGLWRGSEHPMVLPGEAN